MTALHAQAAQLAATGANASTLVLAAAVVIILGGVGIFFARRNG